MPPTRRRLILALAVLAAIALLAALGFVAWAGATPTPMPEALVALESDDTVVVETAPWYTFRPATGEPTTGLVFYPGGKIDPRSYAPAARALAEQGFLVVIPPMPLNLAVLAPDRASEVMAAYPEVRHWAVGGHSLGGAMAAHFVARHPEAADGLVLWGAYAAEGDDLSGWPGQVTSVSATNDGLSTPADIAAGKPRLPPTTTYVIIEGGNHAQFGWYGPQDGDGEATISRADQQAQAIAATGGVLAAISG